MKKLLIGSILSLAFANDSDFQRQWQDLQRLPLVEGYLLKITPTPGPSKGDPSVKELTADELMKLLETFPSAPPSQTVPQR